MAFDAAQEGVGTGGEGQPSTGDDSAVAPPATSLTTNVNDSEVVAWFKAQKLGSIVPALVENGWDDMYVKLTSILLFTLSTSSYFKQTQHNYACFVGFCFFFCFVCWD